VCLVGPPRIGLHCISRLECQLSCWSAGSIWPGPDPSKRRYGHIAFAVDDVVAARDAVLAAGGHALGDLVDGDVVGAGRITFVYVTDPEGNIIELQRWSK
jgi:catechol 2,3-dioxygenase-like lactoylglutathione lyase family enzyme